MNMFSFHVSQYLELILTDIDIDRIVGLCGRCPFNLIRKLSRLLSKVVTPFIFWKQYENVPPHFSNIWHRSPFDDSHSNGCVVIIHFDFNLHLLTTNDCEPVFICLLAIHVSSSGRGLFKYFVYFLSVLFTFLLNCKSFCVLFCIHILIRCMTCK